MSTLIPCLWFAGNAEEAARFYAGLLPGGAVETVTRSPIDYPAGKAGDVLTVTFRIGAMRFVGLNGGSGPTFSEAVSFQLICADQAEADRLTEALSAVPDREICGWVKDRFGLSWQIVPRRMIEILEGDDRAAAARAMAAMMDMRRIDIAAIEAAAKG